MTAESRGNAAVGVVILEAYDFKLSKSEAKGAVVKEAVVMGEAAKVEVEGKAEAMA